MPLLCHHRQGDYFDKAKKEVTYESQEKKSQKEIKGMSHNRVTEMSHRIESQK